MTPLAVLLASSSTSAATVERWVEALVAGHDELPSLVAVQAAAEAQLGLATEKEAEAWSRSARLRAWIPRLDFRAGTDRTFDVRLADVGVTDWSRAGQGFVLSARASWNLADVWFDEAELGAERVRIARADAVRAARERVTKLYFERVELLIRHRLAPSLALLLEAKRIDGLIRALTGERLDSVALRKM